jgi:hypothetical protein
MPIILATWETEIRRIMVKDQHRQIVSWDVISKLTRAKWTGDVAKVVECLLYMQDVLSSNSDPTKKKRKLSTNFAQWLDDLTLPHLTMTTDLYTSLFFHMWFENIFPSLWIVLSFQTRIYFNLIRSNISVISSVDYAFNYPKSSSYLC